jgi:hypothetical protein
VLKKEILEKLDNKTLAELATGLDAKINKKMSREQVIEAILLAQKEKEETLKKLEEDNEELKDRVDNVMSDDELVEFAESLGIEVTEDMSRGQVSEAIVQARDTDNAEDAASDDTLEDLENENEKLKQAISDGADDAAKKEIENLKEQNKDLKMKVQSKDNAIQSLQKLKGKKGKVWLVHQSSSTNLGKTLGKYVGNQKRQVTLDEAKTIIEKHPTRFRAMEISD